MTGQVIILVEDSGPGIPESKRGRLFSKFQESLDSLHQGKSWQVCDAIIVLLFLPLTISSVNAGTGIGLAVCRHLIDLMGGDIVLDESHDSGIPGCPGARFVVHLNQSPIAVIGEEEEEEHSEATTGLGITDHCHEAAQANSANPSELPEHLQVLFVDDDYLLRRLFQRSLKRIVPTWQFDEAANGETALSMAQEKEYDLIFMDQYMSSVTKQLLGTEAVRALRAHGISSCICGLSANDMEDQFIRSGANSFMMKPFPCSTEPLTLELLRVLQSRNTVEQQHETTSVPDAHDEE